MIFRMCFGRFAVTEVFSDFSENELSIVCCENDGSASGKWSSCLRVRWSLRSTGGAGWHQMLCQTVQEKICCSFTSKGVEVEMVQHVIRILRGAFFWRVSNWHVQLEADPEVEREEDVLLSNFIPFMRARSQQEISQLSPRRFLSNAPLQLSWRRNLA